MLISPEVCQTLINDPYVFETPLLLRSIKNGWKDTSIVDSDQNTPMILALTIAHEFPANVFKTIFDASIYNSINVQNNFGKTALMYAFQYNTIDVAMMLMKNDNINVAKS